MLASPLLQDYPIRRNGTVFLVAGERKENPVSELELTPLQRPLERQSQSWRPLGPPGILEDLQALKTAFSISP